MGLKPGVAVLMAVCALLPATVTGAHAGPGIYEGRCKPGGPVRVVAFGDSLTAGYGLTRSGSFPVQLEKALKARGHDIVVTNAGVSGDTTGGGLARFDWAVGPGTDAVILELGANDMLRGIAPRLARGSLDKILARLKARKIAVLLTGIRAMANWGDDYKAAFDPMFGELATKHDTLLYPRFLEGVAGDPALNQSDGLHPTRKGIAEIVKRILPKAEALVLRAVGICDARANMVGGAK